MRKCSQNKKKVAYTLYIGKVGSNIPSGVKFSFIPSSLKYVLLYTDKKVPADKFAKVDEEKTKMPQEVREWLFLTKAKINYEYLKTKREEISKIEKEFFTAFEKELEKEQASLEKGQAKLENDEHSDGE